MADPLAIPSPAPLVLQHGWWPYAPGMPADAMHARLLRIALALPGAYEDRPWGSVHCKVAGKIFVGWGRDEDGEMSVGFKTDKQLQTMLVASDARFTVARYVGKHGWVDMRIGAKPDWAEVATFIADSYRMIAPKKLVRQLDGGDAAGAAPSPRRSRASTPSRRRAAPAERRKETSQARQRRARPGVQP